MLLNGRNGTVWLYDTFHQKKVKRALNARLARPLSEWWLFLLILFGMAVNTYILKLVAIDLEYDFISTTLVIMVTSTVLTFPAYHLMFVRPRHIMLFLEKIAKAEVMGVVGGSDPRFTAIAQVLLEDMSSSKRDTLAINDYFVRTEHAAMQLAYLSLENDYVNVFEQQRTIFREARALADTVPMFREAILPGVEYMERSARHQYESYREYALNKAQRIIAEANSLKD